jgi:hypothetical protein
MFDETTWDTTKAALLEGDDIEYNQDGTRSHSKKKLVEYILDNARRDIFDPNFLQITAPIIRKIVPNLFANELIGVHSTVDGMIHTLRVQYAEPIQALEVVSPFDVAQQYDSHAALEGIPGNRISIKIHKVDAKLEEKKYPYNSVWYHSPRSKEETSELMANFAKDAIDYFDRELVETLLSVAGEPTSIFDCGEFNTGRHTFIGDVHAAFAILINRQCNLIAARTRRGAGNKLVVSPTGLTILQSACTSAFARTCEGIFSKSNTLSSIRYVGTLNNSVSIFCNPFAPDNTPALITYKGNESDAGAIFAINNPFIIGKPQPQEDDHVDGLSPPMFSNLLHKTSLHLFQNTEQTLGNAADYMGVVGINTESLTFV